MLAWGVVGFAVLVAAALGSYHLVAEHLVTVADREAERDPETGWRRGMGERELGPADARGAVLMVHGFIGGWNNFADLPEKLAARGWRVRMMRLPGHGTSPRDYAATKADELLEAVRVELAALREDHDTVVVVGHSMGSALSALAVAEQSADRLVLGAPYFGVTHRWWYGLRPETWTRLASPVLRWVYKGKMFLQVNRPEAKDRIETYAWVPVRGLLTLQEIGRRVRRPGLMEEIECPVLVIHSTGDVAASYDLARQAFEKLEGEGHRFLRLERSNHHVYWDWEKEEVHRAVLEFVGDAPERSVDDGS